MTHDPLLDPLATAMDPDYVHCFEQMAEIEVTIRRRGPSPHLLMRRATILMALGNYAPALQAARDAVLRSPRHGDAHFQEGLAWVALARVQCGAVVAPGVAAPAPRPLMTLLENAYGAFCAAATCAEGDDEALDAARRLEAWLRLDEPTLIRALSAS